MFILFFINILYFIGNHKKGNILKPTPSPELLVGSNETLKPLGELIRGKKFLHGDEAFFDFIMEDSPSKYFYTDFLFYFLLFGFFLESG